MLADVFESFAQVFSPPFRQVMWKSLGLTTAVLVLAGVGLDRLALSFIHVGPVWLSTVLSVVVALGLAETKPEPTNATSDVQTSSGGAIHIELPGRAIIRVESGAELTLLRRILESLRK